MPEAEVNDIQESEQSASKLKQWKDKPASELKFLGEATVAAITASAEAASEQEKDQSRPFFRKVMLTLPSWYRSAATVHNLPPDLLYTADGASKVAIERQHRETQAATIEREITAGVSPWLARVHHNNQNSQNPYIVGFYQDETGKMRALYGERFFRSQRQIAASDTLTRAEAKEVNLLATEFQQVKDPQIHKGQYWELLPEDLRSHFEDGQILVTQGHDAYALSDGDIETLSQIDSPNALREYVQAAQGKQPDGYSLLYYSDYSTDTMGRTGVLMRTAQGEMKPVVVEIDGKEFVVELKGAGAKSGGFKEPHVRSGRSIITGGAEAVQAVNEFERLAENVGSDGPQAAGSITFDNNGYDQGYIIRLTPSTVRASYSDNDVYPDITTQDNVERILDTYSHELVEHLYSPNPKILFRSSQTENLLVWGNGRSGFTDFADHLALNDSRLSQSEELNDFLTPRELLHYYVKIAGEIPGYISGRDRSYFYQALEKAFSERGRELGLESGDSTEIVTQKIWDQGGMAEQVYEARHPG